MYRDFTVSVVVPALNEQELIGETLSGIPGYVDRVYVVDDASTDKTSEIVKEFQTKDKRVYLIRHEINRGVGAAIAAGYRQAVVEEMDIIAVMAGDNQMEPQYLPRLLDPIVEGRADYTKGNRLFSPDYRKGMSRWRYLGNSILTLLTKVGSGYWHLVDPQNGYTAISKRVFVHIAPETIFQWYGYCNDLLAKLNVLGFRVLDVPIPAKYGREKSKIRYHLYIPRVSWLLLKNFFWRLKMKYLVSTTAAARGLRMVKND